jgi:hypothetical protein
MNSCNEAVDNLIVAFIYVFVVLVVLASGTGWVLNIVKLVPMEGATGMLVLRAVGIVFAPLGVVLGYCG